MKVPFLDVLRLLLVMVCPSAFLSIIFAFRCLFRRAIFRIRDASLNLSKVTAFLIWSTTAITTLRSGCPSLGFKMINMLVNNTM